MNLNNCRLDEKCGYFATFNLPKLIPRGNVAGEWDYYHAWHWKQPETQPARCEIMPRAFKEEQKSLWWRKVRCTKMIFGKISRIHWEEKNGKRGVNLIDPDDQKGRIENRLGRNRFKVSPIIFLSNRILARREDLEKQFQEEMERKSLEQQKIIQKL
jgi:hypothetical protein